MSKISEHLFQPKVSIGKKKVFPFALKTVFSIWKLLQVIQKACIKHVACVIYTYQLFSFTYTLL